MYGSEIIIKVTYPCGQTKEIKVKDVYNDFKQHLNNDSCEKCILKKSEIRFNKEKEKILKKQAEKL
jgi:hypothetical protein